MPPHPRFLAFVAAAPEIPARLLRLLASSYAFCGACVAISVRIAVCAFKTLERERERERETEPACVCVCRHR